MFFCSAEPVPINFKKVLGDNYELISRSLVVTDAMIHMMRLSESPISKLFTDIDNEETPDKRVTKLLTKLVAVVNSSEAESVFESFVSALRDDGQEHVANIFCPESDGPRPMSDEHYQLLVERTSEICKFLDPLNGVLDKLFDGDLFSKNDRQRVEAAESQEWTRWRVKLLTF